MFPTIVGVAMAIYLVKRADSVMRQGRFILALVFCFLAAIFLVEGLRIDGSFYRGIFRILS